MANTSLVSSADMRVLLNYSNVTRIDTIFKVGINYSWNNTIEFVINHTDNKTAEICIYDMDGQARISVFLDCIALVKKRENNSQAWSAQIPPNSFVSAPALFGNTIFVASTDVPGTVSTLNAFNAGNGVARWVQPLNPGRKVRGSVALDYGYIWAGIDNTANPNESPGLLRAYYQSNGTQAMSFNVNHQVNGTPLICGPDLYVLDSTAVLHVFRTFLGTESWNTTVGTGIENGVLPAIYQNKIYTVAKNTTNSVLTALDSTNGQIIWKTNLNSTTSSSPVVSTELVLVGMDNGYLSAYSMKDGSLQWRYSAGNPNCKISTPTFSDGIVAIGATDGCLRAVWKDNGTLIWNISIGAPIASAPSIYQGEIYIGAQNGILYARYLSNGSVIWNNSIGNNIHAPVAFGDIDGDSFAEIIAGADMSSLKAYDGGPACQRNMSYWPKPVLPFCPEAIVPPPEPKHVSTSPTSSDTDQDLLPDGMEETWFFGYDRIEMEDYFDANNQTDHQFSVSLNGSNVSQTVTVPWEKLSMPITMAGHYRLTLSGTAVVRIVGGGNDEDFATALDDQYQFSLRAANITVSRNENSLVQGPIYENRSWHYISTDRVASYPEVSRYWFYIGEFDFSAGDFTIQVKVNDTPFYMGLVNDSRVSMLDITMDCLRVERFAADPFNRDCDNDSVIDGVEINHGCGLWNPDADEDGLSDAQEIGYGTNPECRDTDFDGLRDRIELGLTGETDQYTIWDTTPSRASRFELEGRNLTPPLLLTGTMSNNDTDAGLTKTNATNKDTDSDGLPDGIIDGWSYNVINDEWGNFNETSDNLHNFWEGEDTDLDGAVDTGPWDNGTYSGETNGSKMEIRMEYRMVGRRGTGSIP
jgi:outer membrane protein assembly factor BamB